MELSRVRKATTRPHAFAGAVRGAKRRRYFRPAVLWLFCALVLGSGHAARASLAPSQVMVLVNSDTAISSKVADMYQRLRGIPKENILRLPLGTERQITTQQYWQKAASPVKKYLEANAAIQCIVTTSGVPYTVMDPGGADQGAAFDNELAIVLREEPQSNKRRQPNPLYEYGLNPYGIREPRRLGMVYVARLDGPSLEIITRMVEDAVAVEKTGLQGPVFGDAQGMDEVVGYGEGDASIRNAMDRFSGAGFDATLDMKPASWTQPAGGVGSQAAGAAFYIGWYNLLNFQDIFGPHGLARGAIAWHIASQEAEDIWNPKGKGWCINLLLHGAAVTLGPVHEPYVAAFPHGDLFVQHLLEGASVAESYWLSLPNVSWAMVLLGDPLYSPFAANPKPSLVGQAYIAENSTHVLEKGETAGLLVQIQCIGPPGSATPAFSATAEPDFGLAAASGTISIPALKAGETAVVHVPSVTAGTDPSGMFRLNLNAEGSEKARRIVLEGRIGFSRLTGGLPPKSQLFISPDGKALITGMPGISGLVNTDTLRVQLINISKGFSLIGAEFSPDSRHVALTLVNLQDKKGLILITDAELHDLKTIPAGYQFVRWLDPNDVLLRGKIDLMIHSIAGGQDRNVSVPEGWTATVIPGTDTEMLVSKEGDLAVKKGSEPQQEVLVRTNSTRFLAVANDLSVFGGVDINKRFWVQSGLSANPEIVADGVEEVLWGPISRRAVVRTSSGDARVYDAPDRSWTDLGMVSSAKWSADETRLLYWNNESEQNDFLYLLNGKQITKLCPLARTGPVWGAEISADDQHAFLLASLSGGRDVWMIALPPGPRSN